MNERIQQLLPLGIALVVVSAIVVGLVASTYADDEYGVENKEQIGGGGGGTYGPCAPYGESCTTGSLTMCCAPYHCVANWVNNNTGTVSTTGTCSSW